MAGELKFTLKSARVNANISTKEAAKHIGVTTRTLLNYEKAKSSPKVEDAIKLSQLYGISYDNIFFGK